MNEMEKIALLSRVIEMQKDTSEVILKIGSVEGNRVDNGCLVFLEGPPKLTTVINSYVQSQKDKHNTIRVQPGHGGIMVW